VQQPCQGTGAGRTLAGGSFIAAHVRAALISLVVLVVLVVLVAFVALLALVRVEHSAASAYWSNPLSSLAAKPRPAMRLRPQAARPPSMKARPRARFPPAGCGRGPLHRCSS